RSRAAMPVLASVGLAAVNWMSDSEPKLQSSLPFVRPSGENSGSGLSGSSPGAGTEAATSSSIDLYVMTPSFWLAVLVSITCVEVIDTGNFTAAVKVNTMSLSPALIGDTSGP